MVTKTPSVGGIKNFFKIFPNAHLLILIRDGRAVVESGVRSFDWDFERAARDWAASALAVMQFKQDIGNDNHKYLIVKYEDLFSNTEEELRKIFSFLGLDSEVYNFDAAKHLNVIGSSELRQDKTDVVHWRPVEKWRNFNPIMRWSHWSSEQHERFNLIAGDHLKLFGYTPEM